MGLSGAALQKQVSESMLNREPKELQASGGTTHSQTGILAEVIVQILGQARPPGSRRGHERSWDGLCGPTGLGSDPASVTYKLYDLKQVS